MYYLNLSADADKFKAARRRLRSDLSGKRLAGRPSRRPLIKQSASAEKCRRGIIRSGEGEQAEGKKRYLKNRGECGGVKSQFDIALAKENTSCVFGHLRKFQVFPPGTGQI